MKKLETCIIENRTLWLAIGLNLIIAILAIQSLDIKDAELQQALNVVSLVSIFISVPSLGLYLFALIQSNDKE